MIIICRKCDEDYHEACESLIRCECPCEKISVTCRRYSHTPLSMTVHRMCDEQGCKCSCHK